MTQKRYILALTLVAASLPALSLAQSARESLEAAVDGVNSGVSLESQSQAAGAVFQGTSSPVMLASARGGRGGSLRPAWTLRRPDAGPTGAAASKGSDERKLKIARTGGLVAAGAGVTILGLAVAQKLGILAGLSFAGAGPVGLAAALIFAGGMLAYWAHNKLKGKDILKKDE